MDVDDHWLRIFVQLNEWSETLKDDDEKFDCLFTFSSLIFTRFPIFESVDYYEIVIHLNYKQCRDKCKNSRTSTNQVFLYVNARQRQSKRECRVRVYTKWDRKSESEWVKSKMRPSAEKPEYKHIPIFFFCFLLLFFK